MALSLDAQQAVGGFGPRHTPEEGRQQVAWFGEERNVQWVLFGNMRAAGRFKNRVNDNDEYISLALDCIPLQGEVSQAQDNEYKRNFSV